MKLNLHARIEIALGAALLLGSCATREENEVADVNARNALHRVEALESRVSVIEQRLGM